MLTSKSDRYGPVAAGLHWLIAVLILVAFVSGYVADAAETGQAVYLRTHVAAGGLAGILTLVRVLWWWGFDRKPDADPTTATWARRPMRIVHALLVLLPLAALVSGFGTVALSGAGAVLFGGVEGPLPVFEEHPPRQAHGLATRLLLVLASLHIMAALYHAVVLRDGLLDRMRLHGRSPSSGNRS